MELGSCPLTAMIPSAHEDPGIKEMAEEAGPERWASITASSQVADKDFNDTKDLKTRKGGPYKKNCRVAPTYCEDWMDPVDSLARRPIFSSFNTRRNQVVERKVFLKDTKSWQTPDSPQRWRNDSSKRSHYAECRRTKALCTSSRFP